MQAQTENRGIALRILNLDTLAPHPGYFIHAKKPQYHCMEGWVGSSVGLDQHGE